MPEVRDSSIFDELETRFYSLKDFIQEFILNVLAWMGFAFRAKPDPSVRLDGQTVIVTGGNKGIGREVSTDMARRGARVIIACRDVKEAEKVAQEIKDKNSNSVVKVKSLDLSSIDSVKKFSEEVIREESRIDVLVNNAGLMIHDKRRNEKGWEMMFAINYLGHVYLTMALRNKMKQSSPDPRVIFVSSMAHAMVFNIDWNDLHWERKRWWWNEAYGASKYAEILFARELAQRDRGLRVYSVDPGTSQTNLFDGMHPFVRMITTNKLVSPFFRTVQSAANNVIHTVIYPRDKYNPSNNFHQDGKEKTPSPCALNQREQRLLWTMTREILGMKVPEDGIMVPA